MKAIGKYLVIGLAILLSAWVLGKSYTYKYRTQDRIVVTGLGETEFTSDLIVWRGMVTAESSNVEQGYAQIEASKRKVSDYIAVVVIVPILWILSSLSLIHISEPTRPY